MSDVTSPRRKAKRRERLGTRSSLLTIKLREKSVHKCQGEACREGNWKYRHVHLEPVIVPTTGGVVRTEDLRFSCWSPQHGVTGSKRRFQREQGSGGKEASRRRILLGWVDGTHLPQNICGSSQEIAVRKNAVPRWPLKEGMRGLDDDVSELLNFEDEGTVEVCKWVGDVPLKAFRGLANACEEGRLAEETVRAGTKKIPMRVRVRVSEDDEARGDFTKSIMWKSTVFFKPCDRRSGKTQARSFSLLVLWCVTTNHGEEEDEQKTHEWMVMWSACWKSCDWEKSDRLLSSQVGDTVHDQIGFPACAAPDEKCDNLVCAPKLVSNLLNGNKVRIVVKRLEDGSQRKITDAVWQFVSADNQRGWVSMGESAKYRMALPIVHLKFDLEMFQVRVSWKAMKNWPYVEVTVERNSSSQTQRESKQTNVDHLLDKTIASFVSVRCMAWCALNGAGSGKGIKKAGERVASWHKLATRGEEERRFSSDKQEQEQGIQRNKVRGQFLAVRDRDPQHAKQFCGERHLEEHVSLRNLGDNSSRDWELFFVNGLVCSECVSPPMYESRLTCAARV